ncbi:MAG TPA: response regulator, partial [Vicinamibacterales bacterium]|nr:response regulator [Vicinamibacterales bacterium]
MHSEQVAEGRRANTRILVADDEQPVAEVLRRILMKDGHTVEVVNDGLAALQAVEAHKPHVVLLDVNMPGMNGIDVCRRLKQDLTNRLTPVILVTGMAQREKRIEGLDAGADDFLSKPVDGQELLARV